MAGAVTRLIDRSVAEPGREGVGCDPLESCRIPSRLYCRVWHGTNTNG